jgi:hypothetical protein
VKSRYLTRIQQRDKQSANRDVGCYLGIDRLVNLYAPKLHTTYCFLSFLESAVCFG